MTRSEERIKLKTDMEAEGLEYQEDWELEKVGYDIEELYQRVEKLERLMRDTTI